MKIGIMQPYMFPYIGYWQLISAVDEFVLLDDVNYIMRGFINRNSILVNQKPYTFSIPIKKASQNKLIMETQLNFSEREKEKFLKRIELAYKKAPYFSEAMPVLENIICNSQIDLTDYVLYQILSICKYLGISLNIKKSSEIKKDNSLHAQERIIEICKKMEADTYINPSGGRKLYDSERFTQEGIKLKFLDVDFNSIEYKQFEHQYIPNLSIIDIMMFNSVDEIKKILKKFDLKEK